MTYPRHTCMCAVCRAVWVVLFINVCKQLTKGRVIYGDWHVARGKEVEEVRDKTMAVVVESRKRTTRKQCNKCQN